MTAVHIAKTRTGTTAIDHVLHAELSVACGFVDPLDVAASAAALTRTCHAEAPVPLLERESPGTVGISLLSDQTLQLRAIGAFDASTARDVANVLDRLVSIGFARVFIDCAGVSFIDIAGLRSFLTAAAAVEHAGGRLVLIDPSPAVAKALVVCEAIKQHVRQSPPTVSVPKLGPELTCQRDQEG